MTEDRRTKAQIIEENTRLLQEVGELRKNAPAPRRLTPEVDALDRCVTALAALQGSSTSYSRTSGGGVKWVLTALADRFTTEGY